MLELASGATLCISSGLELPHGGLMPAQAAFAGFQALCLHLCLCMQWLCSGFSACDAGAAGCLGMYPHGALLQLRESSAGFFWAAWAD